MVMWSIYYTAILGGWFGATPSHLPLQQPPSLSTPTSAPSPKAKTANLSKRMPSLPPTPSNTPAHSQHRPLPAPKTLLSLRCPTALSSQPIPAAGSARIALWYGGARYASSLTFDDALPSQYQILAPMLRAYNYRATFFLNTKAVLRKRLNIWKQSLACWPHWRALRRLGHEIGSHTVRHHDLTKMTRYRLLSELRDSCAVIRQHIPEARCQSLAYPYGLSSAWVRRYVRQHYIAARAAMHRVASHTPYDMMRIPSVTPLQKTPLKRMVRWIDEAHQKRGWLVWMFHGVDGQGWEALPQATYRFLFDQLKQHKDALWIAPFGDVARYIYLRTAFSVETEKIAKDSLHLRFRKDPRAFAYLDPSLHASASTHSLTLRVMIPARWGGRLLLQQGRHKRILRASSTSQGVCHAKSREILFDADPHAGDILLQPARRLTKR